MTLPGLTSVGRERTALAVRGLSKTFNGHRALSGVDLTVAPGEVHALLGENGSGKSTLIKVLAGYHKADPGSQVLVRGVELEPGSAASALQLGCRFVHQDLGLVDSESVADNLALVGGFPTRFATVRRKTLLSTAREDLARVGLDVDPRLPVGRLTLAQRTGVAVARALRAADAAPVSLLVLDEPTATLPEAEVEQLLAIVRRVAAGGVGILYVTHRLEEVFQVADRATVLRDGLNVGLRDVAGMTRRDLVDLLVGTELEDVHRVSEALPTTTGSTPLLRATGLHANGLHGVDVEVHPGDIIGVAGITGSGRDNLLSVLFGALPRTAGEVLVAGGARLPSARPAASIAAGLAHVPAERRVHGVFLDLSVRENLTSADLSPFSRYLSLSRRKEVAETVRWSERLTVRPARPELAVSALSGGNQQKVVLAKWLRLSPKVLLLDEPTQGVDIGAKTDIHLEVLQAARAGVGVLVSSSDTDELAALCRTVLILRDGKVADVLHGDSLTAQSVSRACLGREETRSA
ncbi:MAG: Monosaccharide-transporting ATPase [Frankiales bacterium]|nr:Monosaccharide-transporting ATPase [Frankiales bacterium]